MNKLEFKILKKHFFNLIKLIKDNIETMEVRYGRILDNPINRALIFNTIKNHLRKPPASEQKLLKPSAL